MEGLIIQATLLLMLLSVIAYFKAVEVVARVRELRAGQPMENAVNQRQSVIDLTTVPAAFPALATPPALDIVLQQMQILAPEDRYRLPLGWYLAPDGPRIAFTTLVRGVNHLAITGQSDSGKDNAALMMLLALILQHQPSTLQLCLIDGKGLDFAPFAGKTHTWRLALKAAEIAPAMRALTTERERRADVLRAAEVAKWDEYAASNLPLLVVYISELSLLQDAVGSRELEAWLNSELATGRAFGIRYIVATQTLSNFGTRWRSQIGLYLAGYQPSQSQDQPNTGLTSAEIRTAGGIPPSGLPPPSSAAGVFTAIEGRQAITVRLPYLAASERRVWLAKLPYRTSSAAAENHTPEVALPSATKSATAALECSRAVLPDGIDMPPDPAFSGELATLSDRCSGSGVAVTPEERAAILAARNSLTRKLVGTGEQPSRRAICRRVFNGATGGAAYRKVQAVLDEL